MFNTRTNVEPMPAAQAKASTLKKLIQAAALASVLVPLGTVAVQTAPIHCRFNENGYEGSYGGDYCGGGDSSATPNRSRFDFGSYYFELEFDLVDGADFGVTVTDNTAFLIHPEVDDPFPGYECIPLTENGPCIDFQVDPDEGRDGNWTHYRVATVWGLGSWKPSYDPDRMSKLHDSSAFNGPQAPGLYDFDMCEDPTDEYDPCDIIPDPRIGSGNTDFDSFMDVLQPAAVPEPSSLLLLGAGVTTVLVRRRRRR